MFKTRRSLLKNARFKRLFKYPDFLLQKQHSSGIYEIGLKNLVEERNNKVELNPQNDTVHQRMLDYCAHNNISYSDWWNWRTYILTQN